MVKPRRAAAPLRVQCRPPVWTAFLGAVAAAEALGPAAAFDLVRRRVPAADTASPAWLRQRHSATAVRCAAAGAQGDGDAVVVNRSGIAATVFAADCVPVLIATGEAVAAVHAGWRGLAQGVLASAVRELSGSRFRDPLAAEAWIGPAIGPCCYEVDEDVAQQVQSASGAEVVIRRPEAKPHLDLHLAASRQLAELGLGRISRVDCCVRCDPGWWSYRRDGSGAGRNYAFIWRE